MNSTQDTSARRAPSHGRRRRLRTPIFPQHEAAECGAACLGAVLGHFGRWVSIEELREACAVGRDGSTAADMSMAAKKYGLEVSAWSKEPEELRELELPSILFWEFNHFVVLEGFGKGVYYLNDPANGRRVVSEETFDRAFTGVVMVMRPGPGFRAGGTRPGIVRRLWPWLRDVKGPLAFASLCGLLLALPGLILPVLLSVFVDHVLGARTGEWGPYVAAMAVAAAALTYALTWLQQQSLQKLAIRLSVVHTERLLSRLFRLPAQFFAHRFAGDLTLRAQLVDEVAANSSKQFTGVMIELVMSGLFLALMIVFDPLLAAVVAALGLINAAATRALSLQRNDENRQVRREQALLAGIGAFGLRHIESLRATASESNFFARWSGYQARELNARQKFSELGHLTSSLPMLFLILGAAAVFGLGGLRVMSGEMSIGTLIGFYLVAGNFLQPIGRFVQFADLFQMLEADLQRIEDVTGAPEDPAFRARRDGATGQVETLNGRLRLEGRVELRDVTFGYRRNHPPLIENFSLTVEPGQRVAVIGPTGSGKSTLLKLVSGEYTPWSGQILFDGVPISEVPRRVLTGSVAVVDQHVFLFQGTVRDNLTLWNPTVPDHQLVAAARDALIHDEIMSRSDGYDSPVGEAGGNFSSGQRQRMEVGRALVTNPSVMFLDEATSRLDAVTEMGIDDSLRRRGCTCLIVAHRLSTIRDCDRIIVLESGQEVQRGTHEELIADEQGLYFQLIQTL